MGHIGLTPQSVHAHGRVQGAGPPARRRAGAARRRQGAGRRRLLRHRARGRARRGGPAGHRRGRRADRSASAPAATATARCSCTTTCWASRTAWRRSSCAATPTLGAAAVEALRRVRRRRARPPVPGRRRDLPPVGRGGRDPEPVRLARAKPTDARVGCVGTAAGRGVAGCAGDVAAAQRPDRRRLRRAAAAALAVTLLAGTAACGDDDEGSASTTSATDPGAAVTEPERAVGPAVARATCGRGRATLRRVAGADGDAPPDPRRRRAGRRASGRPRSRSRTPTATWTSCCVMVAASSAQRGRGLMEVTDLGGYTGMLFVWTADTPVASGCATRRRRCRSSGSTRRATSCRTPTWSRAATPTTAPPTTPTGPYRFALEVPQGDLGSIGAVAGQQAQDRRPPATAERHCRPLPKLSHPLGRIPHVLIGGRARYSREVHIRPAPRLRGPGTPGPKGGECSRCEPTN